MTDAEAKRILEALLLVTDGSLMIDQAREVLGTEVEPPDIRRLLLEMSKEYAEGNRGLQIQEVAEGFQMVTNPELGPYVMKLTRRIRSVRLSKPALETLAIIAYRQPLTRIEIEQVRGVDAGGVLETLLKFSLIRVAGRKEAVGRPLLYETTRDFLDHFGLRSLEDLPTLEELKGATGAPGNLTGAVVSDVGPASSEPEVQAQTAEQQAARFMEESELVSERREPNQDTETAPQTD